MRAKHCKFLLLRCVKFLLVNCIVEYQLIFFNSLNAPTSQRF